MKNVWLAALATAFTFSLLPIVSASATQPGKAAGSQTVYRFNFTAQKKAGYINVRYDDQTGAPMFTPEQGYGFVDTTNAKPPREVHPDQIKSDGNGFETTESETYVNPKNSKDYNNYGLDFRIKAPAGAYRIEVTTTSDAGDMYVAVSGMEAGRLTHTGSWDAAGLVPINNFATEDGNTWTYNYANGQDCIDIEVEPKKPNQTVGIKKIVLTPLKPNKGAANEKTNIFTLGDSTVKSYTFEEAPMCGWGQVIDRMFDLEKVNITNYSMGGRSLKNAYAEGRFNDILMTGNVGDYVFIQSGHNDERKDENTRFGRGSTEEMYESYLRDVYLPAIEARGMIPVLVTPMSRVKGNAGPGYTYSNSFSHRKFPDIMKKTGKELGIIVLDLNQRSVAYYNEIGVEGTTAIFMSLEPGETPGKTNGGSYANGHPANKIDGTHYKEALAKQFARIIATEIAKTSDEGDKVASSIEAYLKDDVKRAVETGEWAPVFPEVCNDTVTGDGAYYRNQIEKMVQLGVLSKDNQGRFNPAVTMTTREYAEALCKLYSIDHSTFRGYSNGPLTRETLAALNDDAYQTRFAQKPKYMTDYNGSTVTPDDPNYDPNLDTGSGGTMYYPLVAYEQLTDTSEISAARVEKVEAAYRLGLIRAEKEGESSIARGQLANGHQIEPKTEVTRARAAKSLYFMWVLSRPVHVENDLDHIE